jgi:hypothetical protein
MNGGAYVLGISIFLPDYEWRLQEFLGVRLSWLA